MFSDEPVETLRLAGVRFERRSENSMSNRPVSLSLVSVGAIRAESLRGRETAATGYYVCGYWFSYKRA